MSWYGWIPLLIVSWILLCCFTNKEAEKEWGRPPTVGDFLFYLLMWMILYMACQS